MRKLLKGIFKPIGAIITVGILIWALSCTNFGKVSDFAREVRNTVTEFFAPEFQAAKDGALRIAQEFGWGEGDAQSFLEKYHIDGLEPTELPDNAVVKKTVTKQFLGKSVQITLYRDPGYITVSSGGSDVTLAVSDDKQKYVSLLGQL